MNDQRSRDSKEIWKHLKFIWVGKLSQADALWHGLVAAGSLLQGVGIPLAVGWYF